MKKIVFFCLCWIALNAHAADYTTQKIGNFEFTTGPNGYQQTTQHIGNFSYSHDNLGNTSTTQRIGDYEYRDTDSVYRLPLPLYQEPVERRYQNQYLTDENP